MKGLENLADTREVMWGEAENLWVIAIEWP